MAEGSARGWGAWDHTDFGEVPTLFQHGIDLLAQSRAGLTGQHEREDPFWQSVQARSFPYGNESFTVTGSHADEHVNTGYVAALHEQGVEVACDEIAGQLVEPAAHINWFTRERITFGPHGPTLAATRLTGA